MSSVDMCSTFHFWQCIITPDKLKTLRPRVGYIVHCSANDTDYVGTGSEWVPLGTVAEMPTETSSLRAEPKLLEFNCTNCGGHDFEVEDVLSLTMMKVRCKHCDARSFMYVGK